jgi:hypothetical protein
MSRLDLASARFSAALAKLEAAMAETALRADKEAALLKQEREKLLSRVAALEEESNSLAGLTQAVETRLDGAIAEIRAALARS